MCEQGMLVRTLRGHTSYVFCVNYNTACTLLASGSCDGDIRLWNPNKGAQLLASATKPDRQCAIQPRVS
jgi:WD40 repeat protein